MLVFARRNKKKNISQKYNVSAAAVRRSINSADIATEICKHHIPTIPLSRQYLSEKEIESIISSVAKALEPIMRRKKISIKYGYEVAYFNGKNWSKSIRYDPKLKVLFKVFFDEGKKPKIFYFTRTTFENLFEDAYENFVEFVLRLSEVLSF